MREFHAIDNKKAAVLITKSLKNPEHRPVKTLSFPSRSFWRERQLKSGRISPEEDIVSLPFWPNHSSLGVTTL